MPISSIGQDPLSLLKASCGRMLAECMLLLAWWTRNPRQPSTTRRSSSSGEKDWMPSIRTTFGSFMLPPCLGKRCSEKCVHYMYIMHMLIHQFVVVVVVVYLFTSLVSVV